jgi:hypothetical protein
MLLPPDASPESLEPFVLAALAAYPASHPLDFLLLVRARQAAQGRLPHHRQQTAAGEALLSAVDRLAETDPEDALILRSIYFQKQTEQQLSFRLNLSRSQINRRKHQAVRALCTTLLAEEQALQNAGRQELELKLPPRQYSQLFGMDEALGDLAARLQAPHLRVLALTGMGGLGKTALAHALALASLRHYEAARILWVSAAPLAGLPSQPENTANALFSDLAAQLLPPDGTPASRRERLLRLLKREPHLIILDNLEDGRETARLIEQALAAADPSRFILTTRASPAGAAGVFVQPVPELGFEAAAALLQAHAAEIGLPAALTPRAETDLRAVYGAVGGNPLALKIVAGMCQRFALPEILGSLGSRRLGQVEALYARVFQQAWIALSPDARALLAGMPLVGGNGGAPAQLLAFSGLPEERFWGALNELLNRSLVEVRGSLSARRYGIHALTRNFLLAQEDSPQVDGAP